MLNNDSLNQVSGADSTNYQALGNIIVSGISYTDVKEIAIDVFKENCIKFTKEANDIAMERANELIDDLLEKIDAKKLEIFKKPSMQIALYEAQKSYVKTGDKDLEELLVDILIQRVNEEERSLKQIVFDEALEIIPKINQEQMDILTLVFFIYQVEFKLIADYNDLLKTINIHILPFLKNLKEESSAYEHLFYTGCVTRLQYRNDNILTRLNKTYKNLIQGKNLIEKIPELKLLNKISQGEGLTNMRLTTVGCAIVQANFKKVTGININFDKWIA
jgi:hypothetical protein